MSLRIHQGHKLRRGRISESGRPYLVTTVTRNRRPRFHDWHSGRLLVKTLRELTEKCYADSIAWVIMPDHLHWLMTPAREPLDAVVRRLKSCSAREINLYTGMKGSVWQKGYHDHAIRKHEELVTVARYVISNPLRAGIVRRIGDYSLWDCIYL